MNDCVNLVAAEKTVYGSIVAAVDFLERDVIASRYFFHTLKAGHVAV